MFWVCTIQDDAGNPAIPGEKDIANIPHMTILSFPAVGNNDTLSITVFVWKDTADTIPVPNALVDVSVSGGWISSNTIITNTEGYATVRFSDTVSGNQDVVRQITFTYSTVKEAASITVSNKTTTLQKKFLTISANPYVVKADGISHSTITLKVKNKNFNPIIGDTVLFTTNAGDITAKAVTDSNGTAIARLVSERRNVTAQATATLAKDTAMKISVEIEFNGISLSVSASPQSIIPNGVQQSTVTLTLQDAATQSIYGERVRFTKKAGSSAIITPLDTVTDTRGQAKCYVTGTGTGFDTIVAHAAGDSEITVINYSSNYLSIDTTPAAGTSHTYLANGKDSTLITITYLAANQVTPVANATINVSVTSGTIDTFFTISGTTNSSGKISFYLKNPDFATTATITATASSGSETTNAAIKVYFWADTVVKIDLNGSPEVISIGGNRAIITAAAYDVNGNRVKNAIISFQLASGPGAGEAIDPPTAITNESGMATSNLISGSSPSKQQDVWVIASNYNGVKSNVFKFTIAGPPAHIAFKKDVGQISENPNGTYTKNCAALVTDVNRNPVVDSTAVTFSAQISGYHIYKKVIEYNSLTGYYTINIVDSLLPFEDFNDNFKRDPDESDYTGYPLHRGEDLVWYAGDRRFNPGPPFWDYNCNGRRDYDSTFKLFQPAEPYIVDDSGNIHYIDINKNNKRDWYEPLVDTTISDAEYEADPDFIPGYGYPDVDWNNNGAPDPLTTIIILKNIKTGNGQASNRLTYGQSDALRIQVKIWVESEGISSKSPEIFMLPILEDDYKYFRPLEGKKYY